MASCQTIRRDKGAWNLLLHLQMQQYLRRVDPELHDPVQGKGRVMESRMENCEYTEHCLRIH